MSGVADRLWGLAAVIAIAGGDGPCSSVKRLLG